MMQQQQQKNHIKTLYELIKRRNNLGTKQLSPNPFSKPLRRPIRYFNIVHFWHIVSGPFSLSPETG